MRPAGVAPSRGAPGPGEARLLASGALVQQIAQASGLLVLLVIVTVLARRLSVAELGAYGLVASLAGYLLVLRNSVASSAVRAMAGALDRSERGRMFCAAAALYAVVGVATGRADRPGRARDRHAGSSTASSAATPAPAAPGSGCSRRSASPRRSTSTPCAPSACSCAAAVTEIVAVALYLALMLALILGGADLAWVIALSGAIPLLSGLLSAVVARRSGVPVRFERGGRDARAR